MAVRRPLYVTAGGHLQEMTSAQISEIIAQTCYQYSQNPSVTLNVVSSGGSLGTISDTRLQAGVYSTRVDRAPTEAETAEPTVVTVNYSKINQTVASVSDFAGFSSLTYPLYWTGSGLQAMSKEDIYNTFVEPAIDILVSSSTTAEQGGTYQIYSSTTLSGNTLVDATAVFSDTRASISAYQAADIPETLDQPTTYVSFYLHQINGADSSYTRPVGFTSGSNMQTHTKAEFGSALQTLVRYAAANRSNYKIRYSYNSGNNRGSGMTDRRLNGDGNWQTRFVSADDYRAQEFPNGSEQTINTYYLKIAKSA